MYMRVIRGMAQLLQQLRDIQTACFIVGSNHQKDPIDVFQTKGYGIVVIAVSSRFIHLYGRRITQLISPVTFFFHVGTTDQFRP